MMLSRQVLNKIRKGAVSVPDETVFNLPEKVLQFGTGVLLRGLPDFYIDKANRQGVFNGRVVAVKSTTQGDHSLFQKQDGLYTLCIRALENGGRVEENTIVASISRVIDANKEWSQVLKCAHNREIEVIFSNTTEVGIQLTEDNIGQSPPISFPGKLLAFLYERYKAFDGNTGTGMVIVPTELIPENGTKLKSIVLALARFNNLSDAFMEWLERYNTFCNSLVDRIVPGKPEAGLQKNLEESLGYSDSLLTMSESYNLWAIEGDEQVKNKLSFAQANKGVIIQPDIELYRELKLRLLNGTHTLSCGLAYLSGHETVKAAMENKEAFFYMENLMQNELAPSIPYAVSLEEAGSFGQTVLDRFRNPYINHLWINITVQYSSKMKMRCVPVLITYYRKKNTVPFLFALGFAAYLLFMKVTQKKDGKFFGERDGEEYPVQDDQAEVFRQRWQSLSPAQLVKEVLSDQQFWGHDLILLPGFYDEVLSNLITMIDKGTKSALKEAPVKIEKGLA